jgi:hypothetical protein
MEIEARGEVWMKGCGVVNGGQIGRRLARGSNAASPQSSFYILDRNVPKDYQTQIQAFK